MTTVVVLASPPDEGSDLTSLSPDPLSPADATALYRAMLRDVCAVVEHGEADLLVNYPTAEQGWTDGDAEEVLRDLLQSELAEPDAVRFEPQVGQTYAGRVGNAVTHLLTEEEKRMVAVTSPLAPLLAREHVGTAAMKLRSSEVVLGPSPDGGVYFAGFTEPVNFTDAFETPALETLTGRAIDAGHSVDFLQLSPVVESLPTLQTLSTLVASRAAAGRNVPPRTTAILEELAIERTRGAERADN